MGNVVGVVVAVAGKEVERTSSKTNEFHCTQQRAFILSVWIRKTFFHFWVSRTSCNRTRMEIRFNWKELKLKFYKMFFPLNRHFLDFLLLDAALELWIYFRTWMQKSTLNSVAAFVWGWKQIDFHITKLQLKLEYTQQIAKLSGLCRSFVMCSTCE